MAEMLTIGQVADRAGLATSALRYYDERGLVEPATRISGQRRYDPQVLRRLRIVALCQQAGFTLAEIEQLLDGAGDWRPVAEAKLEELDRRIRELRDARRLVRAALDCDCAHLEGCEDTAHDVPWTICATEPEVEAEETETIRGETMISGPSPNIRADDPRRGPRWAVADVLASHTVRNDARRPHARGSDAG